MDYTKLHIKDEAFSKETFKLRWNKDGVLETHPRPEHIKNYYRFDDYISHQDEKLSLLGTIYDGVKQIMFNQKWRWIKHHKPEITSLLDFGCGTGEFLKYIQQKKIRTIGVEPVEQASDQARKNNIKVYKSIQQVQSKFDVISLFHVLEHVDDYHQTISDLIEKLEEHGIILIAVPNYKSYDAAFYKEKWAAWDVPRHIWHFSRNDLKNIGKIHNLELLQIKPLWFDALYISMVSESYRGQNSWKGIYRGLMSNLKAKKTLEYSSNVFMFRKREL
jgi:2-polyprenyl-3-methyl-5-hydroxy-6-metoxy-1,4-benzoquinol methylase